MKTMNFTSLEDVPIILVAGEDNDLCVRNKGLALELLLEQAELGSSIYCLYVQCGPHDEELVCVISEDFDTEAIAKSSDLANAIGIGLAEQTSDILKLHWNLSAVSDEGYELVHEETSRVIPKVCLN